MNKPRNEYQPRNVRRLTTEEAEKLFPALKKKKVNPQLGCTLPLMPLVIVILVLVVLFSGEPDLMDAIIARLMAR